MSEVFADIKKVSTQGIDLMTSMKESIRRLVRGAQERDSERSEFAYSIYWTGVVRDWNEEKRNSVHIAITDFVRQEGFEENVLERRYQVPEVDSERHSGVSLTVLLEVLEAFR